MIANTSDGSSTIVDVCMFVNADTKGHVINDYDKAAAAVQLGLEYARTSLLPDNVAIEMHFIELGPSCLAKSSAMNRALQLRDMGVTCRVFIGPGTRIYRNILTIIPSLQHITTP